MDFIDEEHIALLEIGQKCGKVASLGDHWSGGGLEVDAKLLCHDLRQRGFAETGRPDEQHMVQRLATVLCRLDKHLEIGASLGLAGKIVQRLRAHCGVDIFTALVRRNQSVRIAHRGHSIVLNQFKRWSSPLYHDCRTKALHEIQHRTRLRSLAARSLA
ncbi:hypothetical protein D3C87_1547270 [compost metagenome]